MLRFPENCLHSLMKRAPKSLDEDATDIGMESVIFKKLNVLDKLKVHRISAVLMTLRLMIIPSCKSKKFVKT